VSANSKNILRTIIGNIRRSLLLLLITALGAAFFVGLRSTSPNMNITLDRYFNQQNMYDVRVISNYGLTDKDISRLGAVEGVDQTAPAYSADLFAKLGDASYLFRFHSMAPPESDGRMAAEPLIIEGRMPEHSGECAVSARFARMTRCSLGDVITLSTGDDTSLSRYVTHEKYSLLKSIVYGSRATVIFVYLNYRSLFTLIKNPGEFKNNLGGPIMIYYMTAQTTSRGLSDILMFLAAISIMLAVVNLLPIPVFDGG